MRIYNVVTGHQSAFYMVTTVFNTNITVYPLCHAAKQGNFLEKRNINGQFAAYLVTRRNYKDAMMERTCYTIEFYLLSSSIRHPANENRWKNENKQLF